MARSHESTNLQSMSRLKESAYGTPIAYASGAFKRILQTDKSRWKFGGATANDANHANGSDLAENIWNTTNDASKSFPMQLNYQDVGYWLHMTLGNASVSSSDVNNYLHTFTPLVGAGGQLPSRTFLEKANGNYYLIPGVCVNQLKISGAAGEENDGRLQMSAEVMGNGLYSLNPASYVDPGNQSGLEFNYNHFATLTLDDNDALVSDDTCNLVNWEWNFNNDLQPFYDNCAEEFIEGTPESGLVKNALLLGTRKYTFKFTFFEQPDDPTLTWLKNGAIVSIDNGTESTTTGATVYNTVLEHTRGRVTDVERTAVKNYNVVTGTVELLSSDGTIPLTALVANNVASYLV